MPHEVTGGREYLEEEREGGAWKGEERKLTRRRTAGEEITEFQERVRNQLFIHAYSYVKFTNFLV